MHVERDVNKLKNKVSRLLFQKKTFFIFVALFSFDTC
jgi:hypothetical protein